MGIYYQNPPVHIGAQQPLTPKKLVPPSGPTPDNPVFGSRLRLSTLVDAWISAALPLPPRSPLFIPQLVVADRPPLKLWSTPQEVMGWWIVPPPPRPPSAILLKPALSGPTPQAPPIIGARQPAAVAMWWIPPQARPPSAILLPPPSGPTAVVRAPAIAIPPVPERATGSMEAWVVQIARTLNLVLGKVNGVKEVTLTANATSTTIVDSRISFSSYIALIPLTSSGTAIDIAPYPSARTRGSATISHGSSPATDLDFVVLII